jgi:hypothetical protein
MRYDAANAGAFPNFLLLDAGDRPVALDIVSAFLEEKEQHTKAKAIGERDRKGWVWDTGQSPVLPELPPKAPRLSGDVGRPGNDNVWPPRLPNRHAG